MSKHKSVDLFFRHLVRAARLQCPMCGDRPLFVKWYRVRSLQDWFSPLDGCPSCGYPYEREAGYYLMAIWAINYGVGSVLGVGIYLFLEWHYTLPLPTLLACVLVPICLFNILFARHAKALFLAVDLFFDPHERGGDDGRGNVPKVPPPPASPPPKPAKPCPEVPVLR